MADCRKGNERMKECELLMKIVKKDWSLKNSILTELT